MSGLRRALLILTTLSLATTGQSEVLLEAPGKLDIAYMQQQTSHIDELAARQLGRRLQRDESDLSVLQSLLDRQLVRADDQAGLQAMGIVLGNVLAAQHRLEWVIYRDEKGRSRALQIGSDQQCLFPGTMISRRVSAGVEVDVRVLYDKAGRTIEEVRRRALRSY